MILTDSARPRSFHFAKSKPGAAISYLLTHSNLPRSWSVNMSVINDHRHQSLLLTYHNRNMVAYQFDEFNGQVER